MFELSKFDVTKYDEVLARGLSRGVGKPEGQMCIEAAVCNALGLPHGDDPKCVARAVRSFKIVLNDSAWSSSKARARGLRDLGLAQLGSLGVVDNVEFSKRLAEKTIRVLLPKLFREVFPGNEKLLAAADRMEAEGTQDAAYAADAADAAEGAAKYAAYAAYAARYAADAADASRYAAKYAARNAAYAANAVADAARADFYLELSAQLALDVLRELNSPGISLLEETK